MVFMRRSNNYLLLTAFVAGMSVMSIEMAISRLLAPYFGTSLFVWTNVLALIMVALTIGYSVGGKIADKYPSERLLYQIMLGIGIYLSLVPVIAMPISRFAIRSINTFSVGAAALALVAMVLLLAFPFVALGMFSPYIIRLQWQQYPHIGHVAGKVFTWSNVGSIIGTFIPALVTIPLLGTHKTIMLFACLLMLVGIWGLGNWRLLPIPLLALLLINFLGKIKPTRGLVFDTESVYNYIQVVDRGNLRSLQLNEGHAVHSLYQKDRYLFNAVWDFYLFPPLLNNTQESLFIGLAAGTAARQYEHFFPHIKMDGVEIDPAIVEVGKRYFELGKIANLHIIVQDGRVHLATTQKKYDSILIDAYKQPYIPFHLTTREFFTEVKKHLNPHGVVTINVGSTKNDTELLLMVQQTMKSVFKHVYVVKVRPPLNYLVWATDQESNVASIETSHTELHPLINHVKDNFQEVAYDPRYPVLTDDLAPLEVYTEKMILDFFLSWKRPH